MLFSSITFLFYFLPLVLLGYLLMPSVRAKNRFLLAASLLFYFWGEPWFVLVLLASATVNYLARRGNLWVDWRQVKGFCLVAGSGIASCK